jgi:hypothetical protein
LNLAIAPYLFPEELYQFPQKVVVVMAREWDAYSDDEKALLFKILGSVKLQPGAVQIIAQASLNLSSLEAYNPSGVLVFGSKAEGVKPYEAFQAQGFTVLKADDLPELDDAKKKSLWLVLKTMFTI